MLLVRQHKDYQLATKQSKYLYLLTCWCQNDTKNKFLIKEKEHSQDGNALSEI